jgi:hypothetical protein
MEIPQNLKIHLPPDPIIPFLGIYMEKCKPIQKRDTCTPMLTAAA